MAALVSWMKRKNPQAQDRERGARAHAHWEAGYGNIDIENQASLESYP